MQVVNRIYLNF